MEKIKEYLYQEFCHSTVPKYYKYFEQWFSALTKGQLLFYNAYMNGKKTPFDVGIDTQN